MTPVQKLIGLGLAILLALAIGFGGGWQVQEWRLGKRMSERIAEQGARHQQELDAITGEAWRQQSAELDKRVATEQQLALQDQQHTKELSDAQRNQARLRDQLATADVRLSVLIEDSASGCNVPAAPGAVGVVHAARRAQLDPAHAQRIIAVTDAGDQGLIALRACQAYVRAIYKLSYCGSKK
ncbi:lysis system i-spanin subunit Rz [Pseudomonas fluorescens]|uniref:lysis system i-spanin subunit Rz n=1 Tax=Pseudomonas fluorescens TaxID=294 RepID=UPI000935BAE3|nr:lysis system i-spanin subunit Rz [Pseudomonas fluorescens]